MEKPEKIKQPRISFHIYYESILSLKDLEEVIHIIRLSMNEALALKGISKAKGNLIQKVERIEPGSIDIVMVLNIAADLATIGTFIFLVGDRLKRRFHKDRDCFRENSPAHKEKPLSEKHHINVEASLEDQPERSDTIGTVSVFVQNGDSKSLEEEIAQLEE